MVDTLKEKIELYKRLKERIEKLREREEESDVILTEYRESIALALQLLEKIRDEVVAGETAENIKEEVFKDWLKKKSTSQS